MTIQSDLKAKGWHLSEEGFDLCSENMDNPTVTSVIKKALDMDLREIGGNFLPEDLTRGKLDSISGPGVLQIQKVKNASAPKYEYGSGAPPIMRLLLTDGNNYVNCLQWGQWKSISATAQNVPEQTGTIFLFMKLWQILFWFMKLCIETPPGTKLYLKPGKIPMQSNFLLLSEHQFTVLGGCVTAMVEKWELCKKLASHIRAKENLDSTGPPPWIPFGQPIIGVKPSKAGSNFRALDSEGKEAKEDAIFKQQRQANIAEVSRVKEIKAKSFGGRKDKPLSFKQEHANTPYVQPTDYIGYENDTRRASDSTQDSPMRNRSYPNDKNRKNVRNEYSQPRQDNARPYNSNNNMTGFQPKDNKPENRNKLGAYSLGDFITPDIKQHSVFQVKNSESEPSLSSSSRQQYKVINKDYRPSGDKRSQKNDSRSLVNMMEQVQIYGYDAQDASAHPFLKPGTEVLAKYWEDNQFYRAVITAVGKEGKTCVVRFLDYGNHEEVLISDVKEKNSTREKNWNAGPISFQPAPRNNYENYPTFHNQNYRDTSRSHQNTNRPYGNRQENSRGSRTEYRPSAKIYQPPSQRDTYS